MGAVGELQEFNAPVITTDPSPGEAVNLCKERGDVNSVMEVMWNSLQFVIVMSKGKTIKKRVKEDVNSILVGLCKDSNI